ncbi:MAG TPA: hypothetical protein VH352_13605 [Pseudonocardiaceae bacterium]|nr:hypothetical protein [Pseudonocardiaceae bacterium]
MSGAVINAGAQAQMTAWAQAQAARLESGLRTQSAPGFGGQNYPSYSTTDLYRMVTTNNDPGAVGESGAAWNNMGNAYAVVAKSLGKAVSASESGWTGTAGDAARTFLASMAKWADDTARGAQLAANRQGMQSDAAQRAKNSMPSPMEAPTAAQVRQTMLLATSNPAAGAAQLDQQFQAAQQAHDEAVRVVETYDANLAAVGDTMPAFNPPPAFNPSTSTANVGGASGTTRAGIGPHSQPVGHGAGSASSPTAPKSQAGQPGQASQSGQPVHTNQPDQAGTQDLTTMSASAPAARTGADPTAPPAASFSQPGPGTTDANPLLTSPVPPYLGAPAVGGRAVGAVRVPGGSPGESGGSGARGGAAADAKEVGVMERATPGAGETGGAPAIAAGRGGKGSGDKERKRPSYLANPDPAETFGTDELVAPPVIGA